MIIWSPETIYKKILSFFGYNSWNRYMNIWKLETDRHEISSGNKPTWLWRTRNGQTEKKTVLPDMKAGIDTWLCETYRLIDRKGEIPPNIRLEKINNHVEDGQLDKKTWVSCGYNGRKTYIIMWNSEKHKKGRASVKWLNNSDENKSGKQAKDKKHNSHQSKGTVCNLHRKVYTTMMICFIQAHTMKSKASTWHRVYKKESEENLTFFLIIFYILIK